MPEDKEATRIDKPEAAALHIHLHEIMHAEHLPSRLGSKVQTPVTTATPSEMVWGNDRAQACSNRYCSQEPNENGRSSLPTRAIRTHPSGQFIVRNGSGLGKPNGGSSGYTSKPTNTWTNLLDVRLGVLG